MKAVTLSTPCPYTFAKFWTCNRDAFAGCGPRDKADGIPSTEMGCGLAGQWLWTPEPGRASQHSDRSSAPQLPQPYVCVASFLLMKSNFLCSTPRCISKPSRRQITNFDDGNGGEDTPSFSSLQVQSGTTEYVSGRVKLKMVCDVCCQGFYI